MILQAQCSTDKWYLILSNLKEGKGDWKTTQGSSEVETWDRNSKQVTILINNQPSILYKKQTNHSMQDIIYIRTESNRLDK